MPLFASGFRLSPFPIDMTNNKRCLFNPIHVHKKHSFEGRRETLERDLLRVSASEHETVGFSVRLCHIDTICMDV